MCRVTATSPTLPSKCNCNKTPTDPTEEPNILQPFIPKAPPKQTPLPKNPTCQTPKKQTTHLSQAITETRNIASIALPMILTGLLLYSRSMVSMIFLGTLGELSLAGGALAIGFANITGYSILSGLAMGMEPICGQAFGAKKHTVLGLSLQRTVLLLLCVSLPISLLWMNMKNILVFCGQDEAIATEAQSYIFYSLPDLLLQSLLHPLRIYLRTQSITLPLTYCATLSLLLHLPINYLFVSVLGLGIKGVALGSVLTNFNLILFLLIFISFSGIYKKTWDGISTECLKDWKSLLNLAIPSCISVCLEWWWYEIMILLCGLLLNPKATVASMGILIQTTALIYIFPSSLSFSVSTRVGNELGANRPEKAKLAAMVGLVLSFFLGLSALLFSVMVRRAWARLFTEDSVILELTSMVLPIIGLCELGNCPQTTMCGVLRGTARPRVGANINLGSFYVVGMPVAVVLGFCLGFDFKGLWLGLLAAQMSCAVLMLVVLGRTDWAAEAERAKELTGAVVVVQVFEGEDHGFSKSDSGSLKVQESGV
ncbi:Multi antimicrobial extrusion protein [Cinnamomum micranthum f. kanehirae]|uniref:Protein DETOXIFICATION n=1 Tax=Cinnamomum micranthum f. kanehirae TaxID=337451 RepID=A0A3S3QPG0_9MAGN|nr:Multi antimicrobial extrusion protein [Cinnamomum micranthum f. kanehirae]